ncbi:YgiQ family radical SAM protein [Halosquirtibacter xylanolyticus]|uniref:YgiQ family radical SAM protein n=1 Tax=Halosquirtibacter xylanolyticus TaxID=3374599 RepID=UPI00374A6CCA|nr:YgiQ family radical SAM protein [Prolixibacteraceae bacterium]
MTLSNNNSWLPTSLKEIKERGWEDIDVIYFTGDAYVDHPSFAAAVIGRIMEDEGLKVAIIPQPNWTDDLRDFKKLGKPNLFFAVSGGNMDSMVNHYTANKRRRSNDAYTPDGRTNARPDYAAYTYVNILKELYPDVPVIVGGIEASLRRVTHYDYWSDKLRPGFLADAPADLLFYGMGEKSVREFISLVKRGVPVSSITNLPQTAFVRPIGEKYATQKKWETFELNSHQTCLEDKKKYAENFKNIEIQSNSWEAQKLIQKNHNTQIVINPPYAPLKGKELDAVHKLPFTRLPHPRYKKKGAIPAYDMIRHSVNIHRGCFGGCAFCTISAHQGKFIVSRSEESILQEIEEVTMMPDFKGTISDVGGPSANMYKMQGKNLDICRKCKKPSCIFPKICSNLDNDHSTLTNLYKKVRNVEGVKHAFIGSGIRYDMILGEQKDPKVKEKNLKYLEEVIKHHVSGRLKVAPEHTSDDVLNIMRKPSFDLFHELVPLFREVNKKNGLNQQLIPYFISSHPGCQLKDMADLAIQTKELDFKLEQVQDFTPTPMTVATVIYYSGFHPYTLKPVKTPKSSKDKLEQRQFFFWYDSKQKHKIESSLRKIQKTDWIPKLLGQKSDSAPNINHKSSAKPKKNVKKDKKRRR